MTQPAVGSAVSCSAPRNAGDRLMSAEVACPDESAGKSSTKPVPPRRRSNFGDNFHGSGNDGMTTDPPVDPSLLITSLSSARQPLGRLLAPGSEANDVGMLSKYGEAPYRHARGGSSRKTSRVPASHW